MAEQHTLDIVMSTYNGPADRQPTVRAAVALLNKLVNSREFRARVEGYRWYKYNENLTPSQIYNRLMTGDRAGKGALGSRRTVTFDYTLVDGGSGSTVGYRNAGTNDIFTYRARFDEMDEHDLVSHLCHEVVGHLAGEFDHPTYNWRGRGRSVPYVVDDIIDALLDELPSGS